MLGEDFILIAFLFIGAGHRLRALTLRQAPCQRILPLELSSRATPCYYQCLVRNNAGYIQRLEFREEMDGVPCWQPEPGICVQGRCFVSGNSKSHVPTHDDPLSSKGILLKRIKRSSDSSESPEVPKKTKKNLRAWLEERRIRRIERRLRRLKIAAARTRLQERRKKRLEAKLAKLREAHNRRLSSSSMGASKHSGHHGERASHFSDFPYSDSKDEDNVGRIDDGKVDTKVAGLSGTAEREIAEKKCLSHL